MTVTIAATNGAGTATPETILSPYALTYESRNVILDLVGGGVAVAISSTRLRSGTIEFLFIDEPAARAAAELHTVASSFTVADTLNPAAGMLYVVSGTVDLRLDEASLTAWILSVGYQEIEP